MSWCGDIGEVVEIGTSAGVFSIHWRIPNFLSLACAYKDYFSSPDFEVFDYDWNFYIYPYGVSWNSASQHVELNLHAKDLPRNFRASVGIKVSDGVKNVKKRFQKHGDVCIWNKFCLRSELIEQKTTLIPGNVLTLVFEMKIDDPSIPKALCLSDSSTETAEQATEENPSDESKVSEKQGIEKLSEDFGKLLVSGEDSDVTVQVGDVEFKVHRIILSARAPVFSAMFRHQTEERATNCIKVNDCESDSFRQYLHYLYTGSVLSLTERNVFALYGIADKYLADDLKRLCLEHVRNTLSVQTFSDTVRLAVMYRVNDLLQLAIDFATPNLPLILRSVEWQNFICDCPIEANEILIKCISP